MANSTVEIVLPNISVNLMEDGKIVVGNVEDLDTVYPMVNKKLNVGNVVAVLFVSMIGNDICAMIARAQEFANMVDVKFSVYSVTDHRSATMVNGKQFVKIVTDHRSVHMISRSTAASSVLQIPSHFARFVVYTWSIEGMTFTVSDAIQKRLDIKKRKK